MILLILLLAHATGKRIKNIPGHRFLGRCTRFMAILVLPPLAKCSAAAAQITPSRNRGLSTTEDISQSSPRIVSQKKG